jgi:hypothetical protein
VRRTALKRKPWRRALGTPKQRQDFKWAVLRADTDCVMLRRSFCAGHLQAAHVIPKQRLRRLGYGADVVYSVDSAMCLCEYHHIRHDNFIERVPTELIPGRCRRFVRSLGLYTQGVA